MISSSYVYGARPRIPYYMDEDFPLNVSRTYPEMRDLVEVDTLATAFLWKYPQIRTAILRPVNMLGYYVHSMIGEYLRQRRVPTVMGFDPMMQFIHEEDVSEAIALALEHGLHGVFNVVGPGAVPLTVAIRETGGTARAAARAAAAPADRPRSSAGASSRIPPGAIDFVKYPCTLDGRRFGDATGFRPLFGLEEIFHSVRR